MVLAWVSTLGTFSEPDFRIVTIAPIMKALSKRLGMSKRELLMPLNLQQILLLL